MRPRDSRTDDLWSVVSLDELPDDVLTVIDDDDDEDVATAAAGDVRDDEPPQPSSTTTTTTRTKSAKTKTTRSVVRRNERERNRVKQVNDSVAHTRTPEPVCQKHLCFDKPIISCIKNYYSAGAAETEKRYSVMSENNSIIFENNSCCYCCRLLLIFISKLTC